MAIKRFGFSPGGGVGCRKLEISWVFEEERDGGGGVPILSLGCPMIFGSNQWI